MSVLPFPPKPNQEDFLVGPFEEWRVEIEGRIIPRLTGYRQEDGRVTLIVDGRFMVDFPSDIAKSAAWLIANALAVGEGYSHLGAIGKGSHPFAPIAARLDGEPPQ